MMLEYFDNEKFSSKEIFSGGNKFSSDAANMVYSIAGRSMNSKINTTIEVIGLN